ATKRMARLRTIVQVPVLKSKAPLAVSWLWITFTPRSEKELPDEMAGGEPGHPSAFGRAQSSYGFQPTEEVSEEIERSGDEHAAAGSRALPGAVECSCGIWNRFDVGEKLPREVRQLIRSKCPFGFRLGGDETASNAPERFDHRARVLVGGDRGADHVIVR